MATVQEKITALKEKEAQLKAQRQVLQAREAKAARKNRERRQFLLGLAVEAAVVRGELSREQLQAWLDKGITRSWDREFLGLPERKD